MDNSVHVYVHMVNEAKEYRLAINRIRYFGTEVRKQSAQGISESAATDNSNK